MSRLLALLAIFGLAFTFGTLPGCAEEEGPAEEAADQIEEEADEMEEEVDEATD
jgi:outer membrane lipoprotein-sorting protein